MSHLNVLRFIVGFDQPKPEKRLPLASQSTNTSVNVKQNEEPMEYKSTNSRTAFASSSNDDVENYYALSRIDQLYLDSKRRSAALEKAAEQSRVQREIAEANATLQFRRLGSLSKPQKAATSRTSSPTASVYARLTDPMLVRTKSEFLESKTLELLAERGDVPKARPTINHNFDEVLRHRWSGQEGQKDAQEPSVVDRLYGNAQYKQQKRWASTLATSESHREEARRNERKKKQIRREYEEILDRHRHRKMEVGPQNTTSSNVDTKTEAQTRSFLAADPSPSPNAQSATQPTDCNRVEFDYLSPLTNNKSDHSGREGTIVSDNHRSVSSVAVEDKDIRKYSESPRAASASPSQGGYASNFLRTLASSFSPELSLQKRENISQSADRSVKSTAEDELLAAFTSHLKVVHKISNDSHSIASAPKSSPARLAITHTPSSKSPARRNRTNDSSDDRWSKEQVIQWRQPSSVSAQNAQSTNPSPGHKASADAATSPIFQDKVFATEIKSVGTSPISTQLANRDVEMVVDVKDAIVVNLPRSQSQLSSIEIRGSGAFIPYLYDDVIEEPRATVYQSSPVRGLLDTLNDGTTRKSNLESPLPQFTSPPMALVSTDRNLTYSTGRGHEKPETLSKIRDKLQFYGYGDSLPSPRGDSNGQLLLARAAIEGSLLLSVDRQPTSELLPRFGCQSSLPGSVLHGSGKMGNLPWAGTDLESVSQYPHSITAADKDAHSSDIRDLREPSSSSPQQYVFEVPDAFSAVLIGTTGLRVRSPPLLANRVIDYEQSPVTNLQTALEALLVSPSVVLEQPPNRQSADRLSARFRSCQSNNNSPATADVREETISTSPIIWNRNVEPLRTASPISIEAQKPKTNCCRWRKIKTPIISLSSKVQTKSSQVSTQLSVPLKGRTAAPEFSLQDEDDLNECTFAPKINKWHPKKIASQSSKASVEMHAKNLSPPELHRGNDDRRSPSARPVPVTIPTSNHSNDEWIIRRDSTPAWHQSKFAKAGEESVVIEADSLTPSRKAPLSDRMRIFAGSLQKLDNGKLIDGFCLSPERSFSAYIIQNRELNDGDSPMPLPRSSRPNPISSTSLNQPATTPRSHSVSSTVTSVTILDRVKKSSSQSHIQRQAAGRQLRKQALEKLHFTGNSRKAEQKKA